MVLNINMVVYLLYTFYITCMQVKVLEALKRLFCIHGYSQVCVYGHTYVCMHTT